MSSMPQQRPGASKQDYATPVALIEAVQRRFGPIAFDLAASASNAVVPAFYDIERNALAQDWRTLHGLLWCNPPYARIGPWAEKCAANAGITRTIALLTPASIGASWFERYVHGKALVLALTPRLTFGACTAPYPKDCMLSVYGCDPDFEVWQWR